ncbi:MAG: sporulation protein YqfD [Clostridia bacterium]|nr:sporulation protein YqfD [Clostridia bacterium]
MSINDMLAFLRGGVTIEAEGGFLERFLNICMRRGVFLSDVKRVNDQKITAKMGIKGFKEIRPIAKKTRTRVRISNRSGMPFLLHRYRKRRVVLVGIVLFFGILWYLSTHIMGIDITGNERISAAEIETELKNFGVYRGALVSAVEPKLVQNKMMTRFDDIAWIGVNLKGSRAYIEVRERLDTKKSVDRDVPCNIVASHDGVIKGLEVRAGQTMVKLGDMVEKGDLLVSGAMDSGVVGIRYAHSDGSVYAETLYKKVREYPLEFTEKVYTGQEKKKHSIMIFGKKINLFLNQNQPFEYCDKSTHAADYHLLFGKSPTLTLMADNYREYIPEKRTRTEEEAAAIGKAELCGELDRELGTRTEILQRNVTYRRVSDKTVEVTAEYLCREDIASKVLIDKTENLDYN